MSTRNSRPFADRPLASFLVAAGALWLVSVTVHGEWLREPMQAPRSQELPVAEGSETARARCLTCHGADMLLQQRLSRAGWARELEKMIAWGAAVDDAERIRLLDYFSTQLPQDPALRVPVGSGRAGITVLAARCLTCHDMRLIEQQQLTGAGWSRVIDKMTGWGANVTDSEKDALIEYLVSVPRTRQAVSPAQAGS